MFLNKIISKIGLKIVDIKYENAKRTFDNIDNFKKGANGMAVHCKYKYGIDATACEEVECMEKGFHNEYRRAVDEHFAELCRVNPKNFKKQ